MQTSIDQTKWYDRIWASLIFFTRLPFWRLHQPPKECYSRVVEHWPLAGWLTGGVMAATLYFGSMVLPYTVAVLLLCYWPSQHVCFLLGHCMKTGWQTSSTDSEVGVMTASASSIS